MMDAALQLGREYPDRVEPLYVIGLVHQRSGQGDKAAEYWRKCLEMNPQYAEASLGLAQVQYDKGAYQAALTCYREAAKGFENDPEIPVEIGRTLISMGRLQEAVKILERHLKTHPGVLQTHGLLGRAYSLMRQYDKACDSYQMALRSNPKNENACYGLATAYARLGQSQKAAEYRKRFASLKSKATDRLEERIKNYDDIALVKNNVSFVTMKIGVCYKICGNNAKAEAFLKKAADMDAKNTECRRLLAILYQRSGRPQGALKLFQEMAAAEPTNPEHYMYIGSMATNLKQVRTAETAYRKVITLAPRRPEGYLALIDTYLANNQNLDEAKTLSMTLVRMQPSAQNYYILGVVSLRCGDRLGARAAVEKALEKDRTNMNYLKLYQQVIQ